ncbi:MAG: hypothetical protein NZ534_09905, partial [Bacteroidia bacterium]|nr:hypothetical protein [Bacteroidia bacterium]
MNVKEEFKALEAFTNLQGTIDGVVSVETLCEIFNSKPFVVGFGPRKGQVRVYVNGFRAKEVEGAKVYFKKNEYGDWDLIVESKDSEGTAAYVLLIDFAFAACRTAVRDHLEKVASEVRAAAEVAEAAARAVDVQIVRAENDLKELVDEYRKDLAAGKDALAKKSLAQIARIVVEFPQLAAILPADVAAALGFNPDPGPDGPKGGKPRKRRQSSGNGFDAFVSTAAEVFAAANWELCARARDLAPCRERIRHLKDCFSFESLNDVMAHARATGEIIREAYPVVRRFSECVKRTYGEISLVLRRIPCEGADGKLRFKEFEARGEAGLAEWYADRTKYAISKAFSSLSAEIDFVQNLIWTLRDARLALERAKSTGDAQTRAAEVKKMCSLFAKVAESLADQTPKIKFFKSLYNDLNVDFEDVNSLKSIEVQSDKV